MKAMNPQERLIAAAHRQTVDRCPCVCPGGMMNMINQDIMRLAGCGWPEAHHNAAAMAQLTYQLNQAGGFENYGVPFCMTVEAEAMGATVDMGDEQTEPHIVDPLMASVSEINRMIPFSLQQGRIPVVLEAIRLLRDKASGVPVIGNITGPISVASSLVDTVTFLMELRKQPQQCHQLLERITDNLILYAQAQIAAGAEIICIAEPSGTGEILGRKLFHDYSLLYLNRLLDNIEPQVKIVHICGRLHTVYEELPQLHCDAFSFDACVPVAEIRPWLKGKAVMGNINTHALCDQSQQKIARLVEVAVAKGVDIVAPACGLAVTTPLANICAMVEAAREADDKGGADEL